MNTCCDTCGHQYDDADCTTICPHGLLMSRTLLNQKDKALALFGKPVRFVHQRDSGDTYRVQSVNWEGMVTLDALPGEFAPSLFVVVEEAS